MQGTLLLVRHAESEWNATRRWQGHGDPDLSARGRAALPAIAGRFRGLSVSRLVSSDLRRARDTARAIAEVVGCAAVPDPRLRELDVGRWTGLTRGQIEATDAELLKRFDTEDPEVRAGGAETRRALRERVRAAIESIAADPADAPIALVVHLGVIRAAIPGAEPANGEVLRVEIADALKALER